MLRRAAATAVLLLTLCACALPETDDSAKEPKLSKDANYSSVEDLRKAAVASGFRCKKWERTGGLKAAAVGFASESGSCTANDLFMIFDFDEDLQKQVQMYQESYRELSLESDVLIGPNWLIVSPAAKRLLKSLGGTMMTT